MAGTGVHEEVRAALDEMLDAQNAGDAARLRSMLSERPDAVHIGTDADEWWTSKQVTDSVADTSDDIMVVTDDIDVHVQGDVARAEGRVRFTNSSGGERPVRMTGVLVREDGHWRVVQSHASIGVPDAGIFS